MLREVSPTQPKRYSAETFALPLTMHFTPPSSSLSPSTPASRCPRTIEGASVSSIHPSIGPFVYQRGRRNAPRLQLSTIYGRWTVRPIGGHGNIITIIAGATSAPKTTHLVPAEPRNEPNEHLRRRRQRPAFLFQVLLLFLSARRAATLFLLTLTRSAGRCDGDEGDRMGAEKEGGGIVAPPSIDE